MFDVSFENKEQVMDYLEVFDGGNIDRIEIIYNSIKISLSREGGEEKAILVFSDVVSFKFDNSTGRACMSGLTSWPRYVSIAFCGESIATTIGTAIDVDFNDILGCGFYVESKSFTVIGV